MLLLELERIDIVRILLWGILASYDLSAAVGKVSRAEKRRNGRGLEAAD